VLDKLGGDIGVVGDMENNLLGSIGGEGERMLMSLLEVLMLPTLLEVVVLVLVFKTRVLLVTTIGSEVLSY
jgi:hypothetical protein